MGTVKIVKASAGSGKTYRLTYEYIRKVIGSPWLYRNILAVTFTNKATEEMKQRIVGEIDLLAGGRPSNYLKDLEADLKLDARTIRERALEVRTKILHDYSHFTVVTIDKFFQRIIRAFIKELGIDLNFNLELQTDTLLGSAADRLIDEISTDLKLREWVVRFAEEKIDRNQKWDIKSEITELGKELFKERYKTLAGTIPSKDELSRTTGKAVGQSKAIVAQMQELAGKAIGLIENRGLSIDDFAFGRGGCVSYFVKIRDGAIEKYGKRVSDALASDDKWVSRSSPRKTEIQALVPLLRPMLAELCALYDGNIRFLNTTALLVENFRSFALLSDLSEKIAELCREQNILPISETNAILSKLIGNNDTPFIYEKAGNTFRSL